MPPAALVALLLPLRLLAGDEPASASAPPPTAHEEITVTATAVPTRLAETPAAVTLLDEDELVAAAPLTLDDLLRQVPGFTLFRRTGSRSANPTTQGASLRGIGGSGASRALVLADGIPLNDPFGGWVAWGRVPRLSLVRVEVLRGGASELYGSGALAGVVQLLRRPAGLPGDGGSLLAEGSAGGERTASGGLWAAGRYGAWGASLAREGVTSAGYVPVARTERGPVDSPAGGRHRSVELTVERAAATGVRLFARGSGFDEHRANGTPLQENSTWLRELAAGLDHSLGGGAAAWRLWSTRERYFQTFSTVAADRASERLNRDQRVPSRVVGGTLRWTRPLGDRQTLVAGAETRKTRGESDERAFVGGRAIPSSAGGRQGLGGAFVEELVALAPGWSLAAGVRGDWWHNRATAGAITSEGGGTRRARALSPRLSLRWQASGRWALDLAAYRSFRAPTLNELYRGFRVGDVVTDPNPRLGPERLGGAELGAGWQGDRRRVRATLFTMSLHDPIANVTVATSPGLIRRRRENLGRTRSRGVELEGEAELTSRLSCNASWLLVDATVVRFAADPTLEGRRVAQVPRAQLAASLNWRGDALGAALAARWAGRAFDDDRNNLALGSFLVIDAELARPLPHGLAAFIAVENLFDAEYAVGRTPVETVGAPRLLRLGLRLHRRG